MAGNPYDQFTSSPSPSASAPDAPIVGYDEMGNSIHDDGQGGTYKLNKQGRLVVDITNGPDPKPTTPAPQGSANPYDQFTTAQPGGASTRPPPPDPKPYADPKAFNAEVAKRFDEGASAGDLENFAKDNGYKLTDLANAVALRSDPNGGGFRPSTFWGALENITGPQLNHLAGAVSGALEAPFSTDTMHQNIARDQIGVDAERGQFADDHPVIGTGLGIYGSLKMLPVKGYQGLLGAAQGAMQSDSYNPLDIAVDAGKGAIGAVVGSKLLGGIGAAIAPKIDPMVQRLIDAGVKPTLGQIARVGQGVSSTILQNVEDRATALPIIGDMISRARSNVDTQFRQGALKQVLDPIGVQLPAGLDTGHAMVDYAQKAVSGAYDKALMRMRMIPDQQLSNDVQGLAYAAQNGGLSKPFLNRFKTDVANVVGRRVKTGGGQLDGDALQTTLSSLRQKAARFGASRDAEQQEYGDALGQLADHIENAATRSSPADAVAARDAANEAYAHLVRVEGAAKNATAGDFSPGQLETAVRQGGTRVRGRDVSAGKALGQDYATAARKVLPSRTGSSGSGERLNTANPIKWGIGAALAPGQVVSQRVVAPFLTRQASPTSQALAQLIRAGQPLAAHVAAPLLVRATQ